VAAVMRAHDLGQATVLTQEILRAWGLTTLPQLVRRANAVPLPDFSQLFPLVLLAAGAGDRFAQEVLTMAGGELARLCHIVISRLWSPGQPVRVAIGGGVLTHSALVRQAFLAGLRREQDNVCLSFRPNQPALGALALARAVASAGAVDVNPLAGSRPR
jgi:N-acetylglucosamine kinase-like BadF-type ATPase